MMDPVTNYLNIWNMLAKQIGLEKSASQEESTEEKQLPTS
jgi:hypothetical protein